MNNYNDRQSEWQPALQALLTEVPSPAVSAYSEWGGRGGWETRVWGMQITRKGYRESEDKRRRQSEYRRSVCAWLHVSMSQMANRGCRKRQVSCFCAGSPTDRSKYVTITYVMLISCLQTFEFGDWCCKETCAFSRCVTNRWRAEREARPSENGLEQFYR